jgi:hypothetical protein
MRRFRRAEEPFARRESTPKQSMLPALPFGIKSPKASLGCRDACERKASRMTESRRRYKK